MRAMTFDDQPWVVTMKKNEHYFPTVEWIKDGSAPCGWHRVTYESGKPVEGEPTDGILPVQDGEEAEGMDDDGGI